MPEQTLGFAHFLTQTNGLGRVLLGVLIVMSMASWYLALSKTLAHWRLRQRARHFVDSFWNAPSLDAVRTTLGSQPPHDPFSRLASHAVSAYDHHCHADIHNLGGTGGLSEFLTRSMRKVIDEETARLENGLTLLATVGATAPFVGLLGTVWGVYGALIAIGMSGAGTLDKIAGPVGEALVMTGLGLAVALPAVVAYNGFTRQNRMTLSRLDTFAHDLLAYLTTGVSHPKNLRGAA
jgi:biopolymer transport protein ExbB